jgi:DNA-binding transcriptional MocR family regulator
MSQTDKFLYEEISDNIRRAIETGTLKTGDKLKSVRMMSDELGVSNTTVFKAYFDLEGEGLIESRPKSGYYVKVRKLQHKNRPPQPKVMDKGVCCITNREVIREVIKRPVRENHIELSTAIPSPELLPLAKIKKSIQRSYLNDPFAATCYEESVGNLELRRTISQFALNWGKVYSEDDVVVTAGCMEAISVSLRAVTKPGDTVLIESPTFYGLLQLLDSLSLNVIEIPSDAITGVCIHNLERAVKEHDVKAILLIPNFSNPVGSCMPDSHKERIVEIAVENKVPIIEDDIYGELYFTNQRPKNLKSFDKHGWVIYCSSFSKTLAPGFRVGWCIPGKFKEEVIEQKFVTNLSTSSISQMIILDFLKKGRYELHLKRIRKSLHCQSLKYANAICEYFPEKISFTQPSGGFVIWIELEKTKNALRLYRDALKEEICITPGQIFSAQSDYSNYFRISYGSPYNARIDQAMKRLGELINEI